MKTIAFLTILLTCTVSFAYAQKAKSKNEEVLIEKITSTLSPVNGKESETDRSYSDQLFKKYKIRNFEFHKINVLDGSDCNFTYSDGEEPFPQSLDVGDFYMSRDIYNEDKTIYVRPQYVRYLKNEKNPIASKVVVVFYVYKHR
ncbi:hypothetical protein [Edaphocola aurantiacus]|uniref:hypothetical protein n=1 Tax=Edaphocola aurantiacus TaxID=2601682 RepID=UPI001C942774|nr:hypothetical protein [Edaphocola aurantiacus]